MNELIRASKALMDQLAFHVQTGRFRPSQDTETYLFAMRDAIRLAEANCFESNANVQKALFTGKTLLAGQQDLFNTDAQGD